MLRICHLLILSCQSLDPPSDLPSASLFLQYVQEYTSKSTPKRGGKYLT